MKNNALTDKPLTIREDLITSLKEHLSKILEIPIDKLDTNDELIGYTLDSIKLIELTASLKKTFAIEITPDLFYEYPSIKQFADYLLKHHRRSFQQAITDRPLKRKKNKYKEDIAIIGMSGIFPNAKNIDTLWQNIVEKKDCLTEVPHQRWEKKEATPTWGGFISDIDCFDASFFKISPREAELMDPQQRLLLQVVWQTIENAGFSTEALAKHKVGLFVGISTFDYAELLHKQNQVEALSATGTAHSILANRLSYFLNLRGPSEAIDTACSSSLVALNRACLALQAQECELAIVAGVNALLTPTLFQSFAKAGMLSPDGKCRPFDKTANGYVRGEGIAAILLKPLKNSTKHKGPLHGIIKGTFVNHGGQVNTLTAPNPHAQAQLIIEAFERNKINVNTVTYIETHGTGTNLGDPIEINGLKKAFSYLAQKQDLVLPENSIALGAIKANIGHLEAAAGIAGLIKILLMFKHKKIPPLTHFQSLNPYIHLADTPFYIPKKKAKWQLPQHINKYRAAISAFGFGGSNAHVILEAPLAPLKPIAPHKPYYLITLSAHHPKALAQKIVDLREWLLTNQHVDLSALSYTLNTGRDHFKYRRAYVVDQLKMLQEKLSSADHQVLTITNEINAEKLLKSLAKITNRLTYRKTLETLAVFYCQGNLLRWDLLHAGEAEIKIALPEYPFLKERFWLPQNQLPIALPVKSLHPLIDINTSTFQQIQFAKTFTKDQFYIRDHKVMDEKVLPGSGYLEMVRSACEMAADKPVHTIFDVMWMQFIRVQDKPVTISVELTLTNHEQAAFKIISGDREDKLIHCEGKIGFNVSIKPNAININEIKARTTHFNNVQNHFYDRFKEMGFNYGPSFQVITDICANKKESLVRLALPPVRLADHATYQLHPALLDAVFGAMAAPLLINHFPNMPLMVPFYLKKISLYQHLPHICYAYIKEPLNLNNPEEIKPADILVLDEQGHVLLDITGFTPRNYKNLTKQIALQFFSPTWINEPLLTPSATIIDELVFFTTSPLEGKKVQKYFPNTILIILGKKFEKLSETSFIINPMHQEDVITLATHFKNKQFSPQFSLFYWPQPKNWEKANNNLLPQIEKSHHLFVFWFQILSDMASHPKHHLIWVYDEKREQPHLNALVSLGKSIKLLNPHFTVATIKIDQAIEYYSEQIKSEFVLSKNQFITYDDHVRKVYKLLPHELTNKVTTCSEGGVYLITGGLGGIGFHFAKHLAQQYQAKLVLIGRRALNADIKDKLHELQALGATAVRYLALDISNKSKLAKALNTVREEFGPFKGVLHSAGIVEKTALTTLSSKTLKHALAAKIQGTIFLDQLTKTDPLEFFVTFSSLSAYLGDFGVGTYAYANSFLDHYMRERKILMEEKKRHGISLSLLWPYWLEGGMQLDETSHKIYLDHTGMSLISTQDAISVWEKALSSQETNLLIAHGDAKKINRALGLEQTIANKTLTSLSHQIETQAESFEYKTEQYLKKCLCELTKIPIEHIDPLASFESLGMDSILLIELNQKLNEQFSNLRKTILFEYRTLKELTHYFISEHHEQLTLLFSKSAKNDGYSVHQSAALKDFKVSDKSPTFSLGQERLLFFAWLSPGNINYNLSSSILIKGKLNFSLLQKACDAVIARHDSLRTSINIANWPWTLSVSNTLSVPIKKSLNHTNATEELINKWLDKLTLKPYVFGNEPLLRLGLLKIKVNAHLFFFGCHHVIADAWSFSIFFREVMLQYDAYQKQQAFQIPIPISYYHYAKWQRETLIQNDQDKLKQFWHGFLQDIPPILELPIDKSRKGANTAVMQHYRYDFAKSLTQQLKNYSQHTGQTIFTILFATYQILLYRYSQQESFAIGLPVLGREQAGLQHVIGFFVNTLPIPVIIHSETSFRHHLQHVHETLQQAYMHQALPLPEILKLYDIPRDIDREPLFQTLFNFFKSEGEITQLGELTIEPFSDESGLLPLDLAIEFQERSERYHINWLYNTDLWHEESIHRLATHFEILLQHIIANPDQIIDSLPMLSTKEKKLILQEWNQTEHKIPDTNIVALFEKQVAKTPENVAVLFLQEKTTYRSLNAKANQLARLLIQKGIKSQDIIGIYLDRSCFLIEALLAILKIGAAYLPIDKAYPKKRIEAVIAQSKITYLICDNADIFALPKLLTKDDLMQERDALEDTNLSISISGREPSYVIYTSGSTGEPKGVINLHQGTVNRLLWMKEYCNIKPQDIILQKTPYSFDVSVWELFLPLISGAQLCFAKPDGHKDLNYLVEMINKYHITHIHFVPSVLRQFLSQLKTDVLSLKQIIVSGEALDILLQKMCHEKLKNQPRLINLYGPTEASIDVTYWECEANSPLFDTVPIGRPIWNTKTYILNNHYQPQPIGVPGELYLGGIGLARGYLNRPDQTAERFLFSCLNEHHAEPIRLYKTGDICRWLPDGTIEYLGRKDEQIKLRGCRIELSEIELTMRQIPSLKDAVVILYQAKTEPSRLVAYYTLQDSAKALSSIEIEKYLRSILPDYMVPLQYIHLSTLPFMISGKVDKKSLPEPTAIANISYLAPVTAIQKQLVTIWENVLNHSPIGVHDNFFALGGHSLLLTQLIFEIRKQFKIQFSIREIYQHPTIFSQAQMLSPENSVVQLTQYQDHLQDCHLVDHLPECTGQTSHSNQHILLTGASGFLGTHLLRYLLAHSEAKIYCLIRHPAHTSAKTYLKNRLAQFGLSSIDMQRVELLSGDLAKPHCGIENNTWEFLANTIDSIYHCGAYVHHTLDYESLKASNVQSTLDLLTLISHSKIKKFNYISTLSASFAKNEFGQYTENFPDEIEPEMTQGGYILSKWVSEKLVTTMQKKGYAVNLYRPGQLLGDSVQGIGPYENNHFWLLLKGCIQLNVAPKIDLHFNLLPVDYVAEEIIKHSIQKNNQVVQFSNPHLISLSQALSWLEEQGFKLQQISYESWLKQLEKLTSENALYPLLGLYLNYDLSALNPQYVCAQLTNIPMIDKNLFTQYISHFKDWLISPGDKIAC